MMMNTGVASLLDRYLDRGVQFSFVPRSFTSSKGFWLAYEDHTDMMLWPKFKALAMLAQALVASQLLSSVDAKSAKGDKVLVVIEPALNRGSYSHFWQSLEGMLMGFTTSISYLC